MDPTANQKVTQLRDRHAGTDREGDRRHDVTYREGVERALGKLIQELVPLEGGILREEEAHGVSLGLVVRVRAGRMPSGLDWAAVGSVAPLKGIGFTVAIFIVGLTFDEQLPREQATLAVLIASVAAALIGFVALRARTTLAGRRAD